MTLRATQTVLTAAEAAGVNGAWRGGRTGTRPGPVQEQIGTRERLLCDLAQDQALAISLPGIGSASAVRHSGAPKASAKYCVSCTTCPCANSIMLTE